MKRQIALIAGIAGLLIAAYATPTLAADPKAHEGKEGKEVTISGDGKCAKCSLKETDECQNVIQTKVDGKTVTYYVAKNDEAKKFHKNVCQDTKKVKATGTVKEVDGKKVLTVSKIELATE